jgi:type I restriction enzyme S subunit
VSHSFLDEIIPLGETGDYINGIGFKESDWNGAGLPIIRIQNLTNEEKPFNFTSREVDEKYHVRNGDILVSWSATLDAFVWRRGPALLNQHIFKVVPRQGHVDPRFLYYQLKCIIYSMSRGEHVT